MQAEVIKKCKDGSLVRAYDRAIDAPESARPPHYEFTPEKHGVTYDTAMAKNESRKDSVKALNHYRVSVPCVGCCECIIIQEWENGQYVNNAYFCKRLKCACERFGTCDYGLTGGLGPQVIKRNLTMEEIMAHKGELVN